MNHISLFNGISTTLYAAELVGWKNIAACENNKWCNRHRKKWFPEVECIGDITTADFEKYGTLVDILSGGFPCQNISSLGGNEGIHGAQSSLWHYYLGAIKTLRPRYALIENSGRLNIKGLEIILYGLAQIGYDAEWTNISASNFGADHIRKRMWILAYPNCTGRKNILHLVERFGTRYAKTHENAQTSDTFTMPNIIERIRKSYGEPPLFRDYNGLTGELDTPRRVHGIGNAMYWPIVFVIFKWIDFAEHCTNEEWDLINYKALQDILE